MRAAFAEIVDYAGLFPPATSSMAEALAQYDHYRRSPDRWMLGRFVVAATRLEELGKTVLADGLAPDGAHPWRLSVVIGAAVPAELEQLTAFQREWDGRGLVADSIEIKVRGVDEVRELDQLIPRTLRRHFEVPRGTPYREIVCAIGSVAAFAKVRTGGTTPELFPDPADVASFLAAAVTEQVAFKATAGLHHPFRGCYPITYAPGAESQLMHGFVNMLIATTALARGANVTTAEAILAEPDAGGIVLTGEGITWNGLTFPVAELTAAHERFFLGFGSCSFREPHDELDLERAG